MERENSKSSTRAVFATRFGAIATTVGSAVGLGNIWRFPYEAGMHGGGAFLVCYMAFVFLIGVPVIIAEFIMGRSTRSDVFGAYSKLCPGSLWPVVGYVGIAASLLILSFYSVVAGWTAEYWLSSMFGALDFSDPDSVHSQFLSMTTGWRPVVWTVLFLFCNSLILFAGVTKGIERASNVLMPLLFVLLVAFCINSFTLPGFKAGIGFLFNPDFSKITPSVLLGALGQAFFSLSLGLGCMMTYASYFSRRTRLVRTAVTTSVLDAMVAVLAGVIIFPAVFSFGISPEAGPTLVFETLPHIFAQLPGGAVWSSLFFLLLFMASLTSTVSMSEISIAYFNGERKMSRRNATLLSSVIGVAGGLLCALSFGPLSHVTVGGKTFFDLFDYVSSNVFLPFGGMVCSFFVGWVVDRKVIRAQLAGDGTGRSRSMGWVVFMLKWVCPTAIFIIFLNSVGVI